MYLFMLLKHLAPEQFEPETKINATITLPITRQIESVAYPILICH